MNIIRTLIVDDEELARRRLERLLGSFADIEMVGEAENGAAAVAAIEQLRPDLVFLDVQMPDLDGFEVLKTIESEALPLVISVPAFDQYAVDAFEVGAMDYLLKPVPRRRLVQAVDRAREKLSRRVETGQHLLQFLNALPAPAAARYLQRLPVRAHQRVLILKIDQITSLRVDRGLVCAATPESEFPTKYTALTELDALLDPTVFQRVHRQVMVNINHVREVAAFDNSTARLTLTGGRQVTVSRNHLKAVRDRLQW